jgi:formiminotetrahydrofolate cyclodeaminase
MLSERALGAVLADVAAPTPAPGGGTAAALACALAAALVEMSGGAAESHRATALGLAEADLRSYGPVLEALRLPRDDPARAARVREALSAAADTPLAIAETAAEVASAAATLAVEGRPALEGDAAAGALLAEAAARAAVRLVELNLAEQPADPRLTRARGLAAAAAAARERALVNQRPQTGQGVAPERA